MKSAIALLCLVAGAAFAQTAHSTNLHQPFFSRGYLGVGIFELTDERAKALKLPNKQGLEVTKVDPDTPAARAGLKENDVILEMNGKAVEGREQFQNLIGEAGPGARIGLAIWRNGERQTLTATLEALPNLYVFGPPLPGLVIPAPPEPPSWVGQVPFQTIPGDSPVVGFEGEALGPQLAEFFGVKAGVLVRSVNPNTPAQRAGLKAGDVVTKVNGTPVAYPREITGLVHSSGKRAISFTVVRNKKEITLNVEIAEVRPDREDL